MFPNLVVMLGRSVQLFICRILDSFLLETILAWPQCYCHVTLNSCFAKLCAHCLDLLEQGSVDTFSKSMAQVTVCLGRRPVTTVSWTSLSPYVFTPAVSEWCRSKDLRSGIELFVHHFAPGKQEDDDRILRWFLW